MSNVHHTASDPYGDYTDALDAYRVALERLKHAKAAYRASKAKPKLRTYTLAEIDTFSPPAFKIDPPYGDSFTNDGARIGSSLRIRFPTKPHNE